ncbi:hypothetical protein SS50377_20133 [Spironucleus salmonicida]|uniref:WD domain, G-beta repeat-containing protein n=1 Tax=Spironucleus salmonicida TaxID=348837 RepID=V6LWM7_9EUKA|nr:hypothetical protein SS50377_20133 [Spironucleus salmonicida]|eukprot:EST45189.1 Hypothetical protein SS50377_14762 [Spironucleus salmonicida]
MLKLDCQEIWDIQRHDNQYILVGKKSIYLIKQDLHVIQSFKMQDELYSCCIQNDTIITAGKFQQIYIIDYKLQQIMDTLVSHGGPVNAITCFQDKNVIISGSGAPESAIKIFKDKSIYIIIHNAHETCVDIIIFNDQIVSVGMDGQIKFWSTINKQPGIKFVYKEQNLIRMLYPIDSVYSYHNIIVSHMPNLGFAVIYLNAYNTQMELFKEYHYQNHIIFGIKIANRDAFWYRARGYKNTIATGGKNKCTHLTFPLLTELSQAQTSESIANLFQARLFLLPKGQYRAVIATEFGIIAAGQFNNLTHVFSKPLATSVPIPTIFQNPIDDVFFTENEIKFITGTHELSLSPKIGVGIVKQQ